MSVLERLREVFNLRAFAEEVRYTHTLSYSFVNSGPVSQRFSLSVSLSVSLATPPPLFFFSLLNPLPRVLRKKEKKEREKDTWLLLLL